MSILTLFFQFFFVTGTFLSVKPCIFSMLTRCYGIYGYKVKEMFLSKKDKRNVTSTYHGGVKMVL